MRKILIVDDEQGIRAALGQLLEFEGYEVHTAANAVDGLAEYAKFHPHLVFMDVKMAAWCVVLCSCNYFCRYYHHWHHHYHYSCN